MADATHERQSLLILHAMMKQHMLDQVGRVERSGCYDIVCRGLDGDPLPNASNWPAATEPDPQTAALRSARELIAEIREQDFESYTVGGDPASMDEAEAGWIEECDEVLAQIDGALNG